MGAITMRPGARAAALAVAIASAASSACSDAPPTTLSPPLAGLEHVAAAIVGETVRISAAPTAVAVALDDPTAGARIVRFSFLVADGSPAIDTASATIDHVFHASGRYALQLEVEDDAGRASAVTSEIIIQPALAAVCTQDDASACQSTRCREGACVVIACVGAANCPLDLACLAGSCQRAAAAGDAAP